MRRIVPHLLLAGFLVSIAFLAREWAYGTTYRLLLDQRIDNSAGSTATQRFDFERRHVVPLILMRDDLVVFRAGLRRDATLRAEIRPARQVSYAVRAGDRVVCRGDAAGITALACTIPAESDAVELLVTGEAAVADLRLDRHLALAAPVAGAIGTTVAFVGILRRRGPAWRMGTRGVRAWAATGTALTATLLGLLAVEGALRLAGTRLSPGIQAARRDLGEFAADPRWQYSARYGLRLAAGFRGISAWRDGDIIRMGFLPPALGDSRMHLYEFRTDEEGFRNRETRPRIDIAALGDSFTDAQTIAAAAAWPQQLEARLGAAVQNYGTAGFGPQQELLALKDFALRHSPKLVVLAFFAGNDLHDAEAFESAGRTQNSGIDQPRSGWPIKRIVMRADEWFVTSAMTAASSVVLASAGAAEAESATARPPEVAGVQDAQPAAFDRGVFSARANGRTLRWAFMPPYLNLLHFSKETFERRTGWALAQRSIRDMQRAAQEAGAELIVMFVPFKSQVYLPLLDRAMPREDLTRALEFSLRRFGTVVDVDDMLHNRLALNQLMAAFCREAGIPLLDVTERLRARVEAGDAMFFPDDSHLNEAGEAALAEMLAQFLLERGWRSGPDLR